MFSARIAIRLPSSFMNPPSGFARRLGEERAHEGPERPATALGTRRASLVVLADRHRAGHFLLAPLAEVLVDGHGHPPSGQDGYRAIGQRPESTPGGACRPASVPCARVGRRRGAARPAAPPAAAR